MPENSILDYILNFPSITIQCHNIPDADTLASGWGMYLFLKENGRKVRMVYGGPQPIMKRNLKLLLRLCDIPVTYMPDPSEFRAEKDELLLVMDAQYGGTNTAPFKAEHYAVIDHHPAAGEGGENCLILPEYQCCSTIVWELLTAVGSPLLENRNLKMAFSYALYTDTSALSDLSNEADIEMMKTVGSEYPELDTIKKANLTMTELMVAADALYNNYSEFENHFMIISALKCDQTILGVIGDLAIQVDIVDLVISYTDTGAGYRFSIRSSGNFYHANVMARWIADGLGGGGGHERKGAGFLNAALLKQKYPHITVEEIMILRIHEWIDQKK